MRLLKRVFRFLLKTLLALLCLFFLFLLFERVRGQIALAHFKKELAAKGETLDVQKLLASPAADADNGAPEFLRLAALIQTGKCLTKNPPLVMRMVAPGKAMVGFRERTWVDEKVTNNWADVTVELATNVETLAKLRIVLTRPAFDFRPDYSQGFDETNLTYRLPRARMLCLLLGTAVQNSLHNRECQTAFADLLGAVSLPRVLERGSIAVSEMVRGAISSMNLSTTWEALQADCWTDEQLAMLQKAWEKNGFLTNMVRGLEMERAISDGHYDQFRKSNEKTYQAMLFSFDNYDDSNWWQEFVRKQIYCRVWRFAWSYQDEKFYLEGMEHLIHDTRSGTERARGNSDDWFGLLFPEMPHQNFYDNWRFGMSARSLAVLSKVTWRSARAETERSLVLCAIALKRYSLRYGKPAPDLNALVPEFLAAVPLDYMDGKPMKYRLKPDGTWVLYSVGYDGVDNGGDASLSDPGKGSRNIWAGKDVVWPVAASAEEIAKFKAAGEKF